MKSFSIIPKIVQMDTAKEFCETYQVGEGDLLFVSGHMYTQFFKEHTKGAYIVNYRKYCTGEPTDLMVEAICKDIEGVNYDRVIAVGGGTILDVAKLFALKQISPVVDLYEHKFEPVREKKLVLLPTTCGTGSEVTNIAILELTTRHTKLGLAVPELFADDAVLIPELLTGLPQHVFATSSIDALIHSIESFTSPKASDFTKLFSLKAMDMIIGAYQQMVEASTTDVVSAKKTAEISATDLGQVMLASTFAGIAFGNAGCAAVHAMSYPLGANYHVPHGEANYVMFTAVYKTYMALASEGSIQVLNHHLAELLHCDASQVYDVLEELLGHILTKKKLREYGVTEADIDTFTETVMTKQGRLMANNYTELDAETVKGIYQKLW